MIDARKLIPATQKIKIYIIDEDKIALNIAIVYDGGHYRIYIACRKFYEFTQVTDDWETVTAGILEKTLHGQKPKVAKRYERIPSNEDCEPVT